MTQGAFSLELMANELNDPNEINELNGLNALDGLNDPTFSTERKKVKEFNYVAWDPRCFQP
jgi:hypothetical protein